MPCVTILAACVPAAFAGTGQAREYAKGTVYMESRDVASGAANPALQGPALPAARPAALLRTAWPWRPKASGRPRSARTRPGRFQHTGSFSGDGADSVGANVGPKISF